MTNRTVNVLGWGSGTAEITAILDGTTVFAGEVKLEEKKNIESKKVLIVFMFFIWVINRGAR